MAASPAPPAPRLLRALLARIIPWSDRRHLMLELDALYAARRARHGPMRAASWYLRTTAGFVVRLGRESLRGALAGWWNDQLLVGRALTRRKVYAVTSVLTLAIGLAGVTTVYAIAHWVLLRPVPGLSAPEGLVTLRLGSTEGPRSSWRVAHADLLDMRAGIAALRSLEASRPVSFNLAGDGLPAARVDGAVVTPGWFRTLGVGFVAGRGLSSADRPEQAGLDEVVVAHDLAQLLASQPERAVGTELRANGHRFIVVGVTAEGFRGDGFPSTQRLWLGPAALATVDPAVPPDVFERSSMGVWDDMVGRLHEGASAEAVEAQANGVLERIQQGERPHGMFVNHYTMQASGRLGLDQGLQGSVERTLVLLGVAGGFLLLLAVSNAANLGLMHAATRAPLFAVQRALGAGPRRLVRQLLSEQLVLGLLAGITTVALVTLGSRVLGDLRLDEFGGSLAGMQVEPRVVAAAGLLAVAAALVSGLAPCVLATRPSVPGALKGGGDAPRGARRARDLLVIVQVAASTTLLVGAGLMSRTVLELGAIDLGFDPSGVVAFSIDAESQGYSRAETHDLLRRLRATLQDDPRVRAGFAFPQPLWSSYVTSFLSPSADAERDDRGVGAHLQVSGAFLEALGARVLAGERDLAAWSDQGADAPASVVLSRAAAEQLLPGVSIDRVPGTILWKPARGQEMAPVEVAAVIDDLRIRGPALEAPPIYVWPWAQAGFDSPAFGWVRAPHLSVAELARRVRAAAEAADPGVPVFEIETVERRLATISATRRVVAGLAAALSLLGVLLAAIGLYGVLGYAVTERRREIGIRAALGAAPGQLRRVVLGGGVGRVLCGLVPGLAGALAASRALESLLYGVDTYDAATYAASIAILAVVAGAASWLPARWAGAVSPQEVLRVD